MIEDIVQNMISQLGQSQDERIPGELGVHFADVDERTPKDLLLFTKRFARFINYYSGHIKTPAGTWEPFFTFDADGAQELAEKDDGDTTPHLALLIAFLRLYQEPRQIINGLTRRHLDFFYRRVLQFAKKPAVPDKAHVLIGLKKNSAPITIGPANVFSAGKDDKGVELIYAPTRETVINNAKVESLRSIYVDKSGHGTVRFAPIPKSADGAGAPLPADDPKWHAFGHENLPAAKIGFAIASPLLRMNEGTRKVIVSQIGRAHV